jgi:peptidoglycan hydrolase-like protein with peptidoglycan-binding domain
VSAGAAASEAVRALLEAPVYDAGRPSAATAAAPGKRPVVRRRPGTPTKQRGRAGTTQNADDFNKKHKREAAGRVGGGRFAKESPAEHEAEQKRKEIQELLKKAGVYLGAIDGAHGPVTLAAIKAFQKQNGISPTGTIDERTMLALRNPPPRSRKDVVDEERKITADKRKGGSGSRRGSKLDTSDPAAVRKFQRDNGLKADGVVGPETRAAMRDKDTGSRAGDGERASGSRSKAGAGKSAAGSSSAAGGVLRQGAGMDRKRGQGDVKQLQTALQDLGYDLGDAGVDGKFGPVTTKAVKAFQREHGLKPDGVIGRHTRRLLNLIDSKGRTRRSKDKAPLSADEESLTGRRTAEAALLILEAPDAQPPSQAEREELRARNGDVATGVSLKRDKDGLFVHTHRARSKSFRSVAAIPKTVVRFIEGTG